jgi:hypothetical protein
MHSRTLTIVQTLYIWQESKTKKEREEDSGVIYIVIAYIAEIRSRASLVTARAITLPLLFEKLSL